MRQLTLFDAPPPAPPARPAPAPLDHAAAQARASVYGYEVRHSPISDLWSLRPPAHGWLSRTTGIPAELLGWLDQLEAGTLPARSPHDRADDAPAWRACPWPWPYDDWKKAGM